jgi:GT2 family glycosyltransferase
LVPTGRTPYEVAVACAMESPFGGIHWMRKASAGVRRDADIAVYGAFRRRAFEVAGFFDPSLVRNQDDEFTLRLRHHGGRVVLDPSIHVYYRPRGTVRKLFRQYFEYGRWKIPIMRKYRRASSLRSLVPVVFVVSLLLLSVLSVEFVAIRWLLALEIGLYLVAALAFGAVAARRSGVSLRLLPRVVSVFPTFHAAYGLGMLAGIARAFRDGHDPVTSS